MSPLPKFGLGLGFGTGENLPEDMQLPLMFPRIDDPTVSGNCREHGSKVGNGKVTGKSRILVPFFGIAARYWVSSLPAC